MHGWNGSADIAAQVQTSRLPPEEPASRGKKRIEATATSGDA
jgi:hypothetical protein